ncbi:MAG TPA: OB-fold domain-containing protein [Acidimicrobiales bacterium]|jgi:uncharacterized OB-fold protein|nr:OB-fold domain-containing protein [Acidimicrobiales bacterium]
MPARVPLVGYLALDDGEPHLVANACNACGALYLDRRNACARCGATAFSAQPLATTGVVTSFTIVHRAAPGVNTPFVSATVKLDGGGVVTTNVVDTEPDPEHVQLGMPVRLTTYTVGTDDNGTEAVAFGFAPAV